MIRLQRLTLIRGTKPLLEASDLTLNPGEKVGLIGANGSGKSSLFSMLRDEIHPDGGEADIPPTWRIAHVAQETPALERSALDYAIDGDTRLRQLEAELAAEASHDGHRIGELHAALHDADAYTLNARAEQLLAGLGFSAEQSRLPVASFSGGWRMRLNLAQALMCPSDLLLLDEPTNHLDLETREALTVALAQFEGTLVLISHDRHLLRACTDEFLIVADGGVQPFDGDLDDYRKWLFETKLGTTRAAKAETAAPVARLDRKEERRLEAEARQRLSALNKPIETRIKQLEKRLDSLNARKAEVDAQLADAGIYADARKDELKRLLVEQAALGTELEELEAAWLEQQEALEQLAAAAAG